MAITASNIFTGEDADGNSTSTTASFSPLSNTLYLFGITSRTGISADPNQPTMTGCGITWSVVNTVVYDNTSSSRRRLTVFMGKALSPIIGTLAIDFGGQNQTKVVWTMDKFAGTILTGSEAVVQSVVNFDASDLSSGLTVTLGAFSNVQNATYGVFAGPGWSGNTVGTGFTELGAYTPTPPADDLNIISEWKSINDTSVDITFAGAGVIGGIAIELKPGQVPLHNIKKSISSGSGISVSGEAL